MWTYLWSTLYFTPPPLSKTRVPKVRTPLPLRQKDFILKGEAGKEKEKRSNWEHLKKNPQAYNSRKQPYKYVLFWRDYIANIAPSLNII